MSRTFAFLRAINVGGHTVRMEALRQVLQSLGLTGVETFIASGNVIFDTPRKSTGLDGRIEGALQQALGFEVATFLRRDSEVRSVASAALLETEVARTATAINIGFLKHPLEPAEVALLLNLETAIDALHVDGREIYWLCQRKQSESTFSNAVLEKTLRKQATWRGISTLRKLVDKYPAD